MNLEQAWYTNARWPLLLAPFAFVFFLISSLRRYCYRLGLLKAEKGQAKVVVVGNIAVGGSGKTPVVIWLAEYLQKKGYKVGVVSRGYGGQAPYYPYPVSSNSTASEVGDEPLLIARRLSIPLVISPKRVEAIHFLEQEYNVDIIISDDGLQHYAMQRDLELVVVDGVRRCGNGWLMPVGPLRELARRLKSVPIIVCNGGQAKGREIQMYLEPQYLVNILTGQKRALEANEEVIAIAGIGSPQRFFTSLEQLGAHLLETHVFKDHHAFVKEDFKGLLAKQPLIMTEKDAVKCKELVDENCWYLPVNASMDEALSKALDECLEKKGIK